jgi:hypothetical protein
MSFRMERLGFCWTDIYEVWYLGIFRKCVEKIQVSLKSDKSNGCLTCRHMYICDNISLNSSKNEKCLRKVCRENENTFYVQWLPPKIMHFLRKCGEIFRAQLATRTIIKRRTRFVCWVTKAKGTHSEYVMLIALPLHQWLHENPSALRYTYIACLV